MSLRVPKKDERPIRLLLVDDNEESRRGLRLLFEPLADLEVVGEAGNSEEAALAVSQLDPDVVLMDCRIARSMSGNRATRDLDGRSRRPPRVVLLTNQADPGRKNGSSESPRIKACSSDAVSELVGRLAAERARANGK